MRHTSAIVALPYADGGGLITTARSPSLLLPRSLLTGHDPIPLAAIAARTDHEQGVAGRITVPADAKGLRQ
jgi:hypothetical protein